MVDLEKLIKRMTDWIQDGVAQLEEVSVTDSGDDDDGDENSLDADELAKTYAEMEVFKSDDSASTDSFIREKRKLQQKRITEGGLFLTIEEKNV